MTSDLVDPAAGQPECWATGWVLVGRDDRQRVRWVGCDRGELPFPQVTDGWSTTDVERRQGAAQETLGRKPGRQGPELSSAL
jgi:hypothetical protein